MKVFVAVLFIMHVSQHASAVTVEVNEGAEFIVLPCQVKAPVPIDSLVEWRRSDPSIAVHVRRDNRDQPNDQNELYRRRTALRQDALESGDLSLTLKNISLVDKGTYTCTARQGSTILSQAEVQLQVFSSNDKERDVFLGLFIVTLLLLLVCVGYIGWTIKTSKNKG
ncbi:V-set domain-containing T-cell activation inhibitor 1-like isoform X2 [Thunnus maccoyii]|uniref:V-set domain-containing T-cell activation inhibitor 1-like isoform X2 n=1 Tax=Thunnus maccoyii TaxID=8240 RepID=UPI001C4C1D07|nr:V-set domain-containing T-cell activation inhibitor 1-like isoform X2 [Thunnus maccoyii]